VQKRLSRQPAFTTPLCRVGKQDVPAFDEEGVAAVAALTRILLPKTSTEEPALASTVCLAPSTSTIIALPASLASAGMPLYRR
jgi:hypothetical protein